MIIRPTADAALSVLRHLDAFDAACRAIPGLAEWTDPRVATPTSGVMVGGRLLNLYRRQLGRPGLVAVGDAVATTAPTAGRGVAMASMQIAELLELLDAGADPATIADAFGAWCDTWVVPWVEDHLAIDAESVRRWQGHDVDLTQPLTSAAIVQAAKADARIEPHIGGFRSMTALPASLAPAEPIAARGLRVRLAPVPGRRPHARRARRIAHRATRRRRMASCSGSRTSAHAGVALERPSHEVERTARFGDLRRIRSLVPLDPSQPSVGRPRLDDEFGGLGVESGDDHLGDVGDEHLPVGLLAHVACAHRAGGDRSSGDLRLARPVALLPLLRMKGRTVQGKTWIPARSAPLRASLIEPKRRSPSVNSHSMPEIRGEPSARSVAIVLWRPRRTAAAPAPRTLVLPVRSPSTPARPRSVSACPTNALAVRPKPK